MKFTLIKIYKYMSEFIHQAEFLSAYQGVTEFISGSNCKGSE